MPPRPASLTFQDDLRICRLFVLWVDYDECTDLCSTFSRYGSHNRHWAQTPKNGQSRPTGSKIFGSRSCRRSGTRAASCARARSGAGSGAAEASVALGQPCDGRHCGAASAPRPDLAGSSAIEGTAVMRRRGRVRLFMISRRHSASLLDQPVYGDFSALACAALSRLGRPPLFLPGP
jgi:hypothetical protein